MLAAIGAVVFDVALPIAWRYIKPLSEPTRWFSGWFVYVGVSCALLALAFMVVEPIRFRTRHLRRVHKYPPLWFGIVLAVGLTAIVDAKAPPLHNGIVPPWSRIDVLVPLALVAVLASALRQRPWRWSSRERPLVQSDKTISWDALKEWFQREEPLENGPDLLGHGPIAARIHNAIVQPRNQGIALIGPIALSPAQLTEAPARFRRRNASDVRRIHPLLSCPGRFSQVASRPGLTQRTAPSARSSRSARAIVGLLIAGSARSRSA
jgi:hypothetical protein